MKNLFSLLLFVLMTLMGLTAMAAGDVRGRVVNSSGEAVGYATVVAMSGDRQVAGTTSDEQGRFSLRIADGEYRVIVEFVGYAPVERVLHVGDDVDLGEVVMVEQATEIADVVVSAQMIRREADRFVVDVANSEGAIGKDGVDVLKQSPGVWVDDDGISINGAEGTTVYINDREVRLLGEELVQYIRNLRAEDMAKIEVVPQTGADYDADSAGGVLKITLKRRLDDGVMGSVRMYGDFSDAGSTYSPSASINYHVGRFDLSASGWYTNLDARMQTTERTEYSNMGALMEAASENREQDSDGGFSLSGVAEVRKNHSLGVSFDFWRWNDASPTDSYTSYTTAAGERRSESRYGGFDERENYAATLNYIIKTDTVGSQVKLIADYTQRNTHTGADNSSRVTEMGTTVDSLYNNRNNSLFRVATASVAWDKVLSQHWTLKGGAKYTYNEINSDATYRYLDGGAWVPSVVDDYDISYTENIGALYAIASMNYGRWSAVAGLRGEYTYTYGKGADMGNSYFSLFPNANLSYRLDEAGKHSIVAQYSRTISRPGFWSLTPNRMQISDYTYQTGNPLLDPSYVDTYSLTAVVAYKYSITLSANILKDAIQQVSVTDDFDPRMICLTWFNMPVMNTYSVNVSLPFALTKWWDWNSNVRGSIYEQRMAPDAPKTRHTMAQWSSQMTFKLPLNFFVDCDYFGMTDAVVSNVRVKGLHNLSMTLKKRFGDAWTVTCALRNLVASRQNLVFTQDDFERRVTVDGFGKKLCVRLGVSWNFKSGKAFRAKSVESGSDSESRM